MKTTKQIKKAYTCGRGIFIEFTFNEGKTFPVSESYYRRYEGKNTLIDQRVSDSFWDRFMLWLSYREHKNSDFFMQVKGTE